MDLRFSAWPRGLIEPRVVVTAPNGDLFVTESKANRVRVIRDANGDGKPEVNQVFATDFKSPLRDCLLAENRTALHLCGQYGWCRALQLP